MQNHSCSLYDLEYCLYCLTFIQAKIGGILYDHGRKLGTHYPDLEPGNEF